MTAADILYGRWARHNWVDLRGAEHIWYHGGDAETELMEVELGAQVAFDLFHLDDIWLDWLL